MKTYQRRRFVARTVAALSTFGVACSVLSGVQAQTIYVTVDVTANRHPISPQIYGTAYANDAAIHDLRLTMNRMGGNNTSRYNWQQNADNRGADWYFESYGDASSVPGERGDTFIAYSRSAGADPMMTIPMVGYVGRINTDRSSRASFSVGKYGAQQATDPYNSNAGNGLWPNGSPVTNNDPLDANIAAGVDYQRDWVRHIVSKFGIAKSPTGLRYYLLDNEPGIWHATHRDVHPIGTTMIELRDKSVATATMIKSIDPTAMIAGPEEWGWTNYFYSGYDSQWGGAHNWSSFPDRAKHNNQDMMPYYLSEMRVAEMRAKRRLLDIFTLHCYPQGGEFGDNVSTAMQERRNRSTRCLFDPTYKDETWINDYMRLIPRMKEWVASSYPGTKIGITEYNWGAEGHINGATAQADIYGIFGREGLDIGTRWTTPAADTPTYAAMMLYRNYDGNGSAFGTTSISAKTDAPYETITAYAATRPSDSAITLVIVNKGISTQPMTRSIALAINGFIAATKAQVWQVNSNTGGTISHLADTTVSGGSVNLSLPAPSVTMIVLPRK